MQTHNDEIVIILANRFYLYDLLQHIFGNEPSLQLLQIATGEHTQEAIQLLETKDNEFADIQALLNKVKDSILSNPDEFLDKLVSEYTYLLLGPNKLPAPPWESVYRTKERLIFQESTLSVRRIYLKHQFLPANYPHEADDHIALELNFMAHLAKLSLEKFERESIDEVKQLLADQKSFLAEHLLLWISQFADQIQGAKTHYFYPQVALLTKRFLHTDADIIDELNSLFK